MQPMASIHPGRARAAAAFGPPPRRPCGPAHRLIAAGGGALSLVLALHAPSASANNVGENAAWQFQTSADKANQAMVQDMIQKRRSGYYAAPVYTTTIGRQFNCNVNATAQGNSGTNSTIANSPSTSGAAANATGNDNATQAWGTEGGGVDSTQGNSGNVGSSVNGSTSTSVHGSATQALNSNQSNSGDQSASVEGSAACAFGALN